MNHDQMKAEQFLKNMIKDAINNKQLDANKLTNKLTTILHPNSCAKFKRPQHGSLQWYNEWR